MENHTTTWNWDHSYIRLNKLLFSEVTPTPVPQPELLIYNSKLAGELGIKQTIDETLLAQLAGNLMNEGIHPIAQAYAGHQFGHFNILGDGRAILLGEHLTPTNERFDIQLKGPGRTPYSRNGDGRATTSAMLREYLISEAMHGLHIPTTRSLAVIKTGDEVYREYVSDGAVLTRVAASHIRVGTFQYAAKYLPKEELSLLADDIQQYFGLGCRNVTKLYVPEKYDFIPLMEALKKYEFYADFHKYKHNFDYHLALLIMGNKLYMNNGTVIFSEDTQLFSPISQINYEYYNNKNQLTETLKSNPQVQCIVGNGNIPFGKAQQPSLTDYADGIDTMEFLVALTK